MLEFSIQVANAKPTGNYVEVKSPYTGDVIAKIEKGNKDTLDKALENVHGTFYKVMRKTMPVYQRADFLYKVVDFMKKDIEELAQTISLEGGKPYTDAKVEVKRAINTVKMSADEAHMLDGETLRMDRAAGSENYMAYTSREPIGPVLAISAFNHPLNLICHQVATAFAAGNSVIVKPAAATPISCFKVAEYFKKAGVPEGVISVVYIGGADMEPLVSDSRIRFITFIGSGHVGWESILRKTAEGTHVALEHGGTAPSIVTENANLEMAIPKIVKGAFYHAGQVCVSTQNLFVHDKVYDKVLLGLKEKIEKLKVGDPTLSETEVGPLILQSEVDRVHDWVMGSIQAGATLVCGGEKLGNQCYKPTLLADVNMSMPCCAKEIFGPVLTLQRYTDMAPLLEMLNSSKFCFQASVYTDDINEALFVTKEIEAKACMVNESTAFRVDWMPFGGSKSSGLGTGGVRHSLLEMTEEKLIILNHYKK